MIKRSKTLLYICIKKILINIKPMYNYHIIDKLFEFDYSFMHNHILRSNFNE